MQIVFPIKDSEFNADSVEELKKQIEEYYSFNGKTPSVRIDGEYAFISIDDEESAAERAEAMGREATSLLNAGQFEKARQLLQKVVKEIPNWSSAHRLLAQISFMYDKNEEAAINHLIDALRWNPKDLDSLVLLGNVFMTCRNDTKTALKYFRQAQKIAPENELIANNIAGCEAKLGNFKEAEKIFLSLIQKGTTFAGAYLGLAFVYEKQDEYDKAYAIGIEGLEKSHDRPENPGLKAHLAQFVAKIKTLTTPKKKVTKADFEQALDEYEAKTDSLNKKFTKQHPDSVFNPETSAMAAFMLFALQCFDKMNKDEVKQIAIQIAMAGMSGIHPEKTGYRIKAIDKDFGGREFLAYYYVSWAVAMPEHLNEIGLPFNEAYQIAKSEFDALNNGGGGINLKTISFMPKNLIIKTTPKQPAFRQVA